VLAATDELIRLDKQFGFHRRSISDPSGDEVVQLLITFAEPSLLAIG
jgi:hypothetical protein